MDDQTQPCVTGSSFEAGRGFGAEGDRFNGVGEHELAWVEEDGAAVGDQGGCVEVGVVLFGVDGDQRTVVHPAVLGVSDERVPESDVDAGWLQHPRVERVDVEPFHVTRGADVVIGQEHVTSLTIGVVVSRETIPVVWGESVEERDDPLLEKIEQILHDDIADPNRRRAVAMMIHAHAKVSMVHTLREKFDPYLGINGVKPTVEQALTAMRGAVVRIAGYDRGLEKEGQRGGSGVGNN
jgi:hypothetical protein